MTSRVFSIICLSYLFLLTLSSCSKNETEESCNLAKVINLKTEILTSTEATITFETETSSKEYEVVLSKGTTVVLSQKITATSISYNNLTTNTDYSLTVTSYCDNNLKSGQIATFTFKTYEACNLPKAQNINVNLDSLTNEIEITWDKVPGAEGYTYEIKDALTHSSLLLSYTPSVNNVFKYTLGSGYNVYFEITTYCKIGNEFVPSSIKSQSTVFKTKSLLYDSKVSSAIFPSFVTDCSLIDANAPVLVTSNNAGGNYTIDFNSIPNNSYQTYYFRYTWGSQYGDFPIFIVKKNGVIKVYYKTQDCNDYKNNFEKLSGDIFRQILIPSAGGLIAFSTFPDKAEIYIHPNIELRGKKI
ncbi:MAG: hypothetical protein IPN86_07335 [Saprospiraceae bacterium]|jgi:hypothetical protein|nr:hypothetical protein [Saprospiraceae bacterium]